MSDKTKQKLAEEAIDFKALFTTEIGGRVLECLERRFHIRNSTLSIDSRGVIDPGMVLAREGERNVVLFIKQRIDLNVDALKNRPTPAEGVENEKE